MPACCQRQRAGAQWEHPGRRLNRVQSSPSTLLHKMVQYVHRQAKLVNKQGCSLQVNRGAG